MSTIYWGKSRYGIGGKQAFFRKRAFDVSEKDTKCTKWTNFFLSLIGCAPSLSGRIEWVAREVHDAMLMRFSGENMGQYTSKPDVFSDDKRKAKKCYKEQVETKISQGKASSVAPTQEAETSRAP